ncbi:MAG: Rrf2 family transcriptional regulator [Kiritimatiellota bacterium]|nr:Rrf2 family transcriptional regulator [Kiritimatiellota bacterium]
MASLIKISDAGAMALHAGVYLAARDGRACTAGEMAAALQVSEAHLVKVLQRLTRVGLVRTTRGPKGGYTLARPPAHVSLRDVFEAIEGPLAPVKCLLKHKVCEGRACILGDVIQVMNRQTMAYLTATTLDALAVKGLFSDGVGRAKAKK